MAFSGTTVINQLGGSRFVAMTGASRFRTSKNSIDFKVPRAKNSIKFIKITLTQSDTYDMEFLKMRGELVNKEENVYASDLQSTFTRNTGLDTHL